MEVRYLYSNKRKDFGVMKFSLFYAGFNGSPLGIGGGPIPGPGGFTGGSYGPNVGGAYGPGGLPYNSKSGAGILADEPEENDKKKST